MTLGELVRRLRAETRTVRSSPAGVGLVVLEVELVEETVETLEAAQAWIAETLDRVDRVEQKAEAAIRPSPH